MFTLVGLSTPLRPVPCLGVFAWQADPMEYSTLRLHAVLGYRSGTPQFLITSEFCDRLPSCDPQPLRLGWLFWLSSESSERASHCLPAPNSKLPIPIGTTALAYTLVPTGRNTQASGRMVNHMAMAPTHGLTGRHTSVNGQKENGTVRAPIHGLTARRTSASVRRYTAGGDCARLPRLRGVAFRASAGRARRAGAAPAVPGPGGAATSV